MLWLTGLILLVAAFLVSVILCAVIRRTARRLGFVDRTGHRKLQERPVALGGGVGLFLTTAGIVVAGMALAHSGGLLESLPWLPAVIREHLPDIVQRTEVVLFVLGGAAVMFALGFMDDVRPLSPWTRLAVQVLTAGLIWMFSEELRLTAFVAHKGVSLTYTILWVVGITNAFNLLDNADGLSAGVAAIASLAFLVVAALTHQFFVAALLSVFIGSLAGFLVFNFPPASLFMGDAGSMFVGYVVAVVAILLTYYIPGHGHNPLGAMLAPVVILAVPIYDTLSVVVIRLSQGRSIFSGDRNHFSHRLMELGMRKTSAILTIYLVTLCTGLLAPLLLWVKPVLSLLILANVALMLVLIWLLEHAGRRGRLAGERDAR
ncbi:MAG: MraY family glycosyltransferase [Pirellulales bacterium]